MDGDLLEAYSQRWKPGVNKAWLHLIAGLMWTVVGLMLVRFAIRWLSGVDSGMLAVSISAGILLAIGIYFVLFSIFANKNIARIDHYPKKHICIFAFQSWISYPLIAFMISLGIFLRQYSPLPKSLLVITYIGIGTSLFLASFHYYAWLSGMVQAWIFSLRT